MLLDLGPDIKPRAANGGEGYDSKANRALCRKRGNAPVIPQNSNAKDQSKQFPTILHKAGARIDIAVGRLKRFKRIARRSGETARNFGSFMALFEGFNLIQVVHTAWRLLHFACIHLQSGLPFTLWRA